MNTILEHFMQPASANTIQLVLFFLRISMGIIMVLHGFPKFLGGPSTWRFFGSTMSNLGIHFLPVFWGLACACTEFFGGVSLALGFGTRIACIFLLANMFVALKFHFSNHDSYAVYSHALTLIVIFITFFIIGSGNYSLDYYLTH